MNCWCALPFWGFPFAAANCLWVRSSPGQRSFLCLWRQWIQLRKELDEVLRRLCQDPWVPCLFLISHPWSPCICPYFTSAHWVCGSLQEHCDAWAGPTVSDSVVHPYWGRGHPHCSHHFRDHVSLTVKPVHYTDGVRCRSAFGVFCCFVVLLYGTFCHRHWRHCWLMAETLSYELLLLLTSSSIQDGAALCHCGHPSRRQNA